MGTSRRRHRYIEHMLEPNDARTWELFTVAEAARHAHTTPSTVRAWLCGAEAQRVQPLFTERVRDSESEIWLSFLELVEVIVARRFRGHGVSIEQLRRTRQKARKRWQVEYPLAERRLKLLGGRVLDSPGVAIDIDWPASQPALPELAAYATEVFEYDSLSEPNRDASWAIRFYPAGRGRPLMVDPQFAGGAVAFINRGVTLETVVGRREAGESVDFIADDLKLDASDVDVALQYAGVE